MELSKLKAQVIQKLDSYIDNNFLNVFINQGDNIRAVNTKVCIENASCSATIKFIIENEKKTLDLEYCKVTDSLKESQNIATTKPSRYYKIIEECQKLFILEVKSHV
ncbi:MULTISPECIES: hypothetical protein [unclassified Francisella]|uniref:hypothetical protein n=1 Tax=unclassified Francisella TaxID=2610885 RepID=UPI002E336DFE|nr:MULTISPECIES: hypothetical protein [unclassified Francisella]MED7818897.1 hypothetical protein [Francisella sp. 19S2-4]MED7829734.1 hypothetical protein [Francisella sp. 19S2-10]